MFKKLRNRFIFINLAATSAVLFLAFAAIYFFAYSSAETRPIPPPDAPSISAHDFRNQFHAERQASLDSLLFSLVIVGLTVEVIVAILSYLFAEAAIKPVKSAYDTQRSFIANASHEMKTPLAAISANLEAADIQDNHWIDNISQEITKLTALNHDLLSLAQAEQPPVSSNTANSADIVHEIVESFSSQFAQKSLTPEVSISASRSVSESDFRQIATILIDNALKYSNQLVRITLTADQLQIKNDGAAISAAELPHIFERFYQTDKSAPGVGLGLSIAETLASRNHWHLTANSSSITTFTLTF